MWTRVRQTTRVVTAVNTYKGQSRAGWFWLMVSSQAVLNKSGRWARWLKYG